MTTRGKTTERIKRQAKHTRIIRTHITFEFDPSKVTESEIKDRLDVALMDEFANELEDVHTRWIEALSDSPLFGAARRRPRKAKP